MMNVKKIYLLILLCTFALLLSSCVNILKLQDIRTDIAKNDEGQERAKTLLTEMGNAHGIYKWDEMETYMVAFEDEFFGFLGKRGHPYKEHSVKFKLQYIPNTFDGNLTFLTGKQTDDLWGMQSWNTYEKKGNSDIVFKKNKDIHFWVPTYQYFLEFPLRIQQATALAYAGEKTIDGIACEGVLASWNKTAPQKEIDQYLIWINKEDKTIVKLEYTVRDFYKFISGAAYYKDYKNYDGLLLPSSMPVESNLVKKGFMHEMRILDFQVNQISKDELLPNKNLINNNKGKH